MATKSPLTLKLRAIRPTREKIHVPVKPGERPVVVEVGNRQYRDAGRGWRRVR